MIEATGAQIVTKLLEAHGITVLAGIPGGSVLPLYDELARSGIRHILVRHEQAAGFIAQGIARTTGKPAVCVATSGPGAMNLLTAIADARSDSIPLVAITGQVSTHLIGTDAFQEADTFGLSFPITKHSVMVKSAAELLEAIPKAFEIAASGRPGPVLVDIPRDVQLQRASFESWPAPREIRPRAERYRTEGESFVRAVDEAARTLASAERPVLYAGGGCNSPEAVSGVVSLLSAIPVPVVTSLMGIGCVAADNPLRLGMVGMHGSAAANRAMHDSDVVLAVGVRFDDRATGLIRQFCPGARIIHVDIDAAEVNKILHSHCPIVADAESVLPVIASRVLELGGGGESIARARAEWIALLSRLRDAETETYRADAARSSRTLGSVHPSLFIASIPERVRALGGNPEELIVTTDVGQHQMWTAQWFPVSRPRQLLTSGSLGTMGFGLPAAIGAAIANPGKRVICFSGDGSIMMNVQELATLAELGLDVTVIVLDNAALGMVRQQQELIFAKNYSASIWERSPDLVKIAEGFGIESVDAASPDWDSVAFGGKGPRFVRCRIDQGENVWPFVPAGKANVDAMTGR